MSLAADIERFWSNVDASGDCWEWQRHRNLRGYGIASFLKRQQKAHRVAWEILVGPIPDGMQMDHLCYNTGCVNPDHLEVVTQEENNARRRYHYNPNMTKTHCLRGHPFKGKNLYVRKDTGHRICLACHDLRRKGLV